MRSVLIAFVVFIATCGNAWAWGDTGHKVICEIAFRLAMPGTRAEIRRLLQGDSEFRLFADSCVWPDHPRQRPDEHFVNLPRDSKGLSSEICPLAPACVLTAINSDRAVLASSSADDNEKRTALKFLGHWVGDIHQPLHVSFVEDRGGNKISVSGLCPRSKNLHFVWDGCLVQESLGGSDVALAATDLLNSATSTAIKEWVASTPMDWANESFGISKAKSTKYCDLHGSRCDMPISKTIEIDATYIRANVPVVREQLLKAGVRFSHVLDKTFGN